MNNKMSIPPKQAVSVNDICRVDACTMQLGCTVVSRHGYLSHQANGSRCVSTSSRTIVRRVTIRSKQVPITTKGGDRRTTLSVGLIQIMARQHAAFLPALLSDRGIANLKLVCISIFVNIERQIARLWLDRLARPTYLYRDAPNAGTPWWASNLRLQPKPSTTRGRPGGVR